jgi:RNA recognition motif-containing protein
MQIFVGNLSSRIREEELGNLFGKFGQVRQIKLIKDNYTGESKGYAFIEMYEERDANHAIKVLNSKMVDGKKITVKFAKPKPGNNQRKQNNFEVFDHNTRRNKY